MSLPKPCGRSVSLSHSLKEALSCVHPSEQWIHMEPKIDPLALQAGVNPSRSRDLPVFLEDFQLAGVRAALGVVLAFSTLLVAVSVSVTD